MMHIRILYVPGCPNREPARQLVDRAARTLALDAAVEEIAVTGSGADVPGFAGSPTILVEGCDVEPPPAGGRGLSCRLYENKENKGLPAFASVLNSLAKFKDEGTTRS